MNVQKLSFPSQARIHPVLQFSDRRRGPPTVLTEKMLAAFTYIFTHNKPVLRNDQRQGWSRTKATNRQRGRQPYLARIITMFNEGSYGCPVCPASFPSRSD